MTVPPSPHGIARSGPSTLAADRLSAARQHEQAGCMIEAIEAYAGAIAEAERTGESHVLAEALRRLAVVYHHRNERATALELCRRSYRVADALGDQVLAAEALNTLAGFAFESGAIDEARERFHEALERGGASTELRGRIEQNLGILANIQGALAEAVVHYERSLEAFRLAGDDRGCAIAYHNLGMVNADRERWDEADRHYRHCLAIAERIGDVHLKGLGLLNQAEVHLARQHYDEAKANAEAALAIFDQLGSRLDKADCYTLIGRVYRETGRFMLAESRLRAAVDLAVETGSVLSEAEASRELALLYQAMGRNQDALRLLNAARRLFGRLEARVDLVDVARKVDELEKAYLALVRDWGQSIESADTYTFGHCERVAGYALAVARALGLDGQQQTAIRVGAYLHDLGKVRIPHEILNKPGSLTPEEQRLVQLHPVWGVELLAGVEFPWDIKPIIRWHHERYDGTGYPDRLCGDEIPLAAQIICVADVYDALTTTRSYRPALSRADAVREMHALRHWWRPDVYAAFLRSTLGQTELAA